MSRLVVACRAVARSTVTVMNAAWRCRGVSALVLVSLPLAARGVDPADKVEPGVPPVAWPNSPFLGAVDGVTGIPVPWLCRSEGVVYQLGDTVCMNTHLGVQMARCDLVLNNTSWMPIGLPCSIGSGR